MAKSYAAQYNKAKYLSKDIEQDIRWGENKQIMSLSCQMTFLSIRFSRVKPIFVVFPFVFFGGVGERW